MRHNLAAQFCIGLLLSLTMSLSNLAWSETATATDTEEVIVAREILQKPAATNPQTAQTDIEVDSAPVSYTHLTLPTTPYV